MPRYCTLSQYNIVSSKLKRLKPSSANNKTVRESLLIIQSILNHSDKTDNLNTTAKDIKSTYADCIYSIQQLLDSNIINEYDLTICLGMTDTYMDTKYQSENNGGSTDYYKLPEGAKELQDLIENRNMSWNIGNVFKAVYRLGGSHHSSNVRDINKAIWFLQRELALELAKNEK